MRLAPASSADIPMRGLDDVDGDIDHDELIAPSDDGLDRGSRFRLTLAFFAFGLLNNVLYVIILSAALDLVPATTPKGIVAFFNIFPALVAKVAWPYISDGRIRYKRRIYSCAVISWTGMVVIAAFNSLPLRLFGIGLASFSSGLGELTFLQLSTAQPTTAMSKAAVGAWSSGTGGAGVAGAGLWWILRGLGVTEGLGIASFLPLAFPVVLRFVLPDEGYQPILVNDDERDDDESEDGDGPRMGKDEALELSDKLALAKPLVVRYMLPLFCVYVAEYVINSGVAPTLAWESPKHGLWAKVFKTSRDYYPFWSLTYQTFVFASRSALTLGIPALPRPLLPLPAILQSVLLTLLALESAISLFPHPITATFVLICLEGLMGGTAYCMTFYHVGRDGDEEGTRRAFKMGAVGAADSLGILVASLIAMPIEVALCDKQVAEGVTFCRQ